MKKKFSGIIVLIMALVMILSTMSYAEELGELDLYAPEIYESEVALEAPANEPEQALESDAQTVAEEVSAATDAIKEETPATVEIIEEDSLAGKPVEYAVAAPALETMAVTQTVALTSKKASAQMNVGDSLQITVNEGETGKFASKTKKLATVDANGLVTALKKGKAKITFKPTKGKTRTLTIKIVDPYEPKGVSISQGKTVTVNLGDSLQLGAVLSPGTARTTLAWSSSKKKNVSVDASGTVTALKEGSAKITVKTANKKKATITIKVVDPYKPTGVSITQGKSATLNVGETLQLSAVLSPATAQSGLTWKSSKSKVAKVDANGLVTAVGKGTATITVKTANGKKAKCKVTVNVPNEGEDIEDLIKYLTPDGVKQLIKKYNLKELYPEDEAMVDFYGKNGLEIEVWIENGEWHARRIEILPASPIRFCLDGVDTGKTVSNAVAILQNRGWRLIERYDGFYNAYELDTPYYSYTFSKNGEVYEYTFYSDDDVVISEIIATVYEDLF